MKGMMTGEGEANRGVVLLLSTTNGIQIARWFVTIVRGRVY